MAHATSLTAPSPGLSATLFPNNCWTLQSQRTSECKITTLYRCTERLCRAATRHNDVNTIYSNFYENWPMFSSSEDGVLTIREL